MILESLNDAIYIGKLHIGSPIAQPVNLVFDTGSEYLAVSSSLCNDATTPKNYEFKKYDKSSKNFEKRKVNGDRCVT